MTVYTKEKVAKCRTVVLELLIKVGFYFCVFLLSPKLMKILYPDHKEPLIVSQILSKLFS